MVIKLVLFLAVGLMAGFTIGLFVSDNPKCRVAAWTLVACTILTVVGLYTWMIYTAITG